MCSSCVASCGCLVFISVRNRADTWSVFFQAPPPRSTFTHSLHVHTAPHISHHLSTITKSAAPPGNAPVTWRSGFRRRFTRKRDESWIRNAVGRVTRWRISLLGAIPSLLLYMVMPDHQSFKHDLGVMHGSEGKASDRSRAPVTANYTLGCDSGALTWWAESFGWWSLQLGSETTSNKQGCWVFFSAFLMTVSSARGFFCTDTAWRKCFGKVRQMSC